jgi:hypothetical protein
VQAVFVKQGNRTQHSRTVGFDQAGDSRQNFVQGCAEKDHFQRIEHRIAGQGLRGGMGMLEALAGWVIPWRMPYTSGLSVAMPAVSHKQMSSTLPTRK